MPAHQAFLEELSNLETILKKFKSWGAEQPDFNLADINTPFGVGSVSLNQWLQYIYIPKMRDIAKANGPLPVAQVTPYADEVLKGEVGAVAILTQLKKLDAMTSGNR